MYSYIIKFSAITSTLLSDKMFLYIKNHFQPLLFEKIRFNLAEIFNS